jgi:hypothetical protein
MDQREFRIFLDRMLELVDERVRYQKWYFAKVKLAGDLLLKGYVMLECEFLGAKKPYEWIRAQPITGQRGYIQPKEGDMGMLFFMNGDKEYPKFMAMPDKSLIEPLPKQKKFTLVETPLMGSKLTVDELVGGFIIQSKSPLGLISQVEPMVLGNKLKSMWDFQMDMNEQMLTLIENMQMAMMTHIHQSPIGPTSTPLPPTPAKVAIDKGIAGVKKALLKVKKAFYNIPGNLLSSSNKNN